MNKLRKSRLLLQLQGELSIFMPWIYQVVGSLLVNVRAVRQLLVLLVILPVLFNLVQNGLVSVRADDRSQGRILHDGKLVHSLCALLRVASLLAIPLLHLRLGVDVVVRRVSLCKRHGATSPVGPESTGLDARQVDVPLWLQLQAQGLGEALHSPFRGAIHREGRHTLLPTDRRDLLDQAALRLLLLSHRLERDSRHVEQAEEVDLHLLPDLLVLVLLEAARETVPRVVAHDVDPAEFLQRLVEGLLDGLLVGHVELAGHVVLVAGAAEGQLVGLAGCGDDVVASVEHFLDVVLAEAGGAAGDQEYSRHCVVFLVFVDFWWDVVCRVRSSQYLPLQGHVWSYV